MFSSKFLHVNSKCRRVCQTTTINLGDKKFEFARISNPRNLRGAESVVYRSLTESNFKVRTANVKFCVSYLNEIVSKNRFNVDTLHTLFCFIQKFNIEIDENFCLFLNKICSDNRNLSCAKTTNKFLTCQDIQYTLKILNSMIYMYVKCGDGVLAKTIFNEMVQKYNIRPDIITVNCIVGYLIKDWRIEKVFELISPFIHSSNQNEERMWIILLHSCSELNDPEKCKKLHQKLREKDIQITDKILAATVDMYSKNGCFDECNVLFEEFKDKTVIQSVGFLNAMIYAFGIFSRGDDALKLFKEFFQSGKVKPDDITFVCLLNSCSHSGLLGEAFQIYLQMENIYEIKPIVQHKVCIVDCLSRLGKLQDAEEMIQSDPELFIYEIAWNTLLGGCRTYLDVDRANRILRENIIPLNPSATVQRVLLGNMYSLLGRFDDENNVRNEICSSKIPGQTWLTINGKKKIFTVGTSVNPSLIQMAENFGYKAVTSWSLRGNNDVEKKEALCGHSERRALEYALQETPENSKITLFKNLRVCPDCHSFTESISKATNRIIALRDSYLFHIFHPETGCSCKNHY